MRRLENTKTRLLRRTGWQTWKYQLHDSLLADCMIDGSRTVSIFISSLVDKLQYRHINQVMVQPHMLLAWLCLSSAYTNPAPNSCSQDSTSEWPSILRLPPWLCLSSAYTNAAPNSCSQDSTSEWPNTLRLPPWLCLSSTHECSTKVLQPRFHQ